ncbi:amidohydrolase family protein [Paractinoplanes rishiriensis]|uniref:Amidohydrolase n=1 Tax=Paractinoplanes rishiriensis TaxID=1050105 RepID=A0A919JTC4_9ACTN|nr:amidohydrolase family protein [Actinoplanes rishiriensis]GIE93119.1 amidohydrolase [Actinoplanes rishiriensis]
MTEYVQAATLWWDGTLRTGEALRLTSDGLATPVALTDVPPDAGRRVLPGTLLPGLVDAHVHSGLVDLATVRAGGIAAVWDLGSVPERVAALAASAAAPPLRPGGGAPLPRIRYAGPFLIAPGGYPSDRAWAAPGSWREITTADEATEAVNAAHAAGATLIKVTAHAAGPQLRLFTMTAIADAAHDLGLPVVVHAEGAGTVATAYEAGADLLAHTPWTEPLDRGLIRACAERMRWISTLDIHGWGVPTTDLHTAVGNLRRFLEYGGAVRYGTDLGNGPLTAGVNPREIRALQSAGLTPNDILQAMTGDDITWIPGGLDLDPTRFADTLATARVLDKTVRPRT